MTQCERIILYMRKFGSITTLQAFEDIGCTRLASRINGAGLLTVDVQDERSQERNRAIAINRLESLIVKAAFIPKTRKKTHVPQSAIEKRLKTKKLVSLKKQQRKHQYMPE